MGQAEEIRDFLINWELELVAERMTDEKCHDVFLDRLANSTTERVAPEMEQRLWAHTEDFIAREKERESTWNEATGNDLIGSAFAELRSRGIVALESAGTTIQDGWCNVGLAMSKQDRGAVFFHDQDIIDVIDGKELLLAFGAFEDDAEKEPEASRALAREVIGVLERHGIPSGWGGAACDRIRLSAFEWRKRRWTSAPPATRANLFARVVPSPSMPKNPLPPGSTAPFRIVVVATMFSHGFNRQLATAMKAAWAQMEQGGEGQVGHFGEPHTFVRAGEVTIMEPLRASDNLRREYAVELRKRAASTRGPEWPAPAKIRPVPNPYGNAKTCREWLERVADIDPRAGIYDEASIALGIEEIIAIELGEPYPALVSEFTDIVRRRLREQAAIEERWSDLTMNDRIDRGFRDLRDAGIVVGEGIGSTLQEATFRMDEIILAKAAARGSAFYHRQDLERALNGEGLLLAFSGRNAGSGKDSTLAIGKEVAAALAGHGVPIEWNERVNTRIAIPAFPWRKRRTTRAPDIDSRVSVNVAPAPAAPSFETDENGKCRRCAGKGWTLKAAGEFPEACTACGGRGRP